MTMRPVARIGVATLALGLALVAPAAVSAVQPDDVVAWQLHRDHMAALDGPGLGRHLVDCIEVHGSAAGLLGPSGMMAGGMAGGEMAR